MLFALIQSANLKFYPKRKDQIQFFCNIFLSTVFYCFYLSFSLILGEPQTEGLEMPNFVLFFQVLLADDIILIRWKYGILEVNTCKK